MAKHQFEQYRQAILMAAGSEYRCIKEGIERDHNSSSEQFFPALYGKDTKEILRNGELFFARVDCTARAIASIADLMDQRDRGGIIGVLSRFEIFLRTKFEYFSLNAVSNPLQMAESIRNN